MERVNTEDCPAVVKARLPRPMLAALDAAADLSGMSRAAALRDVLVAGLTARGLWPPPRRGFRIKAG